MIRRLACIVAALAAAGSFVSPATAADPPNPPQGRFSDDWVQVYMAGGKVGYGHSTMTREGDNIRTTNDIVLKLGRADARVSISMEQFTLETIDGTPLEFGSNLEASTMKTKTRGTIKDGKVSITTSQFGMDQTRTLDFPTGAVMAWGQFREMVRRGFEPGTKYTLSTFTPEIREDGPVEAHTEIGPWEPFEFNGHKGKGHRVTVKMESPIGEVEMTSWLNRDGEPLLARMPAPGIGDMVLVASTEKEALEEYLPPEIFMTTTIPVKKRIPYKQADRITYRLRGKSGVGDQADLASLPETDSQKIVRNDDGSVDVIVSRLPRKPGTETVKLDRKALADYLDANLMINTKDPELIKLAHKAADGAKDPYVLADNLRKFVTDYVRHKDLNVGFATASEVCRTREGDCSEHGVLLAALGRINGLPSRVAAGIAYVPVFGNQSDIFGYHMWTQFWIDGKWVDYDAALRESDCSPIRITLAVSSLKSSGLADLSLPLLNRIGAFDLEVADIQTRK